VRTGSGIQRRGKLDERSHLFDDLPCLNALHFVHRGIGCCRLIRNGRKVDTSVASDGV
jgi:hypothetical protein